MQIIGKIVGINTSDGMLNLAIVDQENTPWNLKSSLDFTFQIAHVYIFEVEKNFKERISYAVEKYQAVSDLALEESDKILRQFFPTSPYSLEGVCYTHLRARET